MAARPKNPPAPARRAAPTTKRKPVRIDIVETQASTAREAYLAERLAQIDGWSYDTKPWGPAEMPVPSSLPFGRDPRGRVRARVEEVVRAAEEEARRVEAEEKRKGVLGLGLGKGDGENKDKVEKGGERDRAEEKKEKEKGKAEKDRPQARPESRVSVNKKRWSMLSLKSVVEDKEGGPPSAFKRWSVVGDKGKARGDAPSPSPAVPAVPAPSPAPAETKTQGPGTIAGGTPAARTAPGPPVRSHVRSASDVPPIPKRAGHTRSASDAPAATRAPEMPAAAPASPNPAPARRRSRRWSLQSLKGALGRDDGAKAPAVPEVPEVPAALEAAAGMDTIITHLPERTSSMSPTGGVPPGGLHHATAGANPALPSPAMSTVSLDLDFDIFGLSSDSQSVMTPDADPPPEPEAPAPAPVLVDVDDTPGAAPSPTQLHAERDAWRHEALLLYDQLCYWRLEALERGRERDGWRGLALAAGAHVPPSVVKTLSVPAVAAPLSDAQRRARQVEHEREKGRERVREWHLASIEREMQEHVAREARREAEREAARWSAAREHSDRRELERRVLERRARERHERHSMDVRERPDRDGDDERRARLHRRHSEWPRSSAAEAAADAAAAGTLPLPSPIPTPAGSWSRASGRSGRMRHSIHGAPMPAYMHSAPPVPAHSSPAHAPRSVRASVHGAVLSTLPANHAHHAHHHPPPGVPEHDHDARPRASGWPACDSGRERAREMLTPPRPVRRSSVARV